MNILCVGMMCCDIILAPVPHNILSIDNCRIEPPGMATGGDALNVSISLSKLGCAVSIIGCIGNDQNGHFIIEELEKHGINHRAVVLDNEYPTAVSYVLVDENKERHFVSSNQINAKLCYEDISDDSLSQADVVYFGSLMQLKLMDTGGLAKLFKKAKSMGKTTILDVAVSYEKLDWQKIADEVLPYTDYFLPSWEEASLISQKTELEKVADYFLRYKPKILVIKLGKKGCFISNGKEKYIVGSLPDFPVVDTDGAGDAFVAGFICALNHGFSMLEQAKFANYVASLCVGKHGTSAGIPDFESANNNFNKYFYTVEQLR